MILLAKVENSVTEIERFLDKKKKKRKKEREREREVRRTITNYRFSRA